MRKWVLKAVIQKVLGIMPGGFKVNYLFQKYVSKAVILSDAFFDTMLDHFLELQEHCQAQGFKNENSRVFEIGTGWHAIVPMAFALSGTKEVVTVDLNGHLRPENLAQLLQKFYDYQQAGKLKKWLPQLDDSRWKVLESHRPKAKHQSIAATLKAFGIQQHITDAAKTSFENGYFDLCYSVNVYEHINEQALAGITREISRITRPKGYGYHAIGVYDHFVHVDAGISKFNYLRFSKRAWQLIDNTIQPQNRLRLSYFRNLFKSHGLEPKEEIFHDPEPGEIERLKLHKDWEGIEDLDIPYGTFILQKKE